MLNTLNLNEIKPELINLTGVRLLVLFALLLEAPRSAEEINDYFEKNNYPKNIFSADTLRNDLNSLRNAGCKISRADKSNKFKYNLISHPFDLNIDIDLAKEISILYLKHYKKFSIKQLILLENLFKKLALYTTDENVSEFLLGISLIKNVDKNLLLDLYKACKNEQTITFTYNSPNTGKQNFSFLIEDFEFRSKKLYITGYSLTHKQNAFLLASKILSPITVHLKKDLIPDLTQTVIYELKNLAFNNYQIADNEKILKQENNKITIEYKSDNSFKLMQKLLSYGADIKILSPENIKNEYIKKLQEIQKAYLND